MIFVKFNRNNHKGYLPKINEKIQVYPIVIRHSGIYCGWFRMGDKEANKYNAHYMVFEPAKIGWTHWFLFDLCNGHNFSKVNVWLFTDLILANKFIEKTKKYKFGVDLSPPISYKQI